MKQIGWFNLISLFITIFAVAFGIYQYYDSKEEVEPTFIMESNRQQILSRRLIENAPLKLSKSTGEEIKGNVFAQSFYFFNQGKKPIKKQHIIDPLRLTFGDTSTQLLDAKIIKVSRKVAAPALTIDSLQRNLHINFAILEKDDGFIAQIIYTSQSEPQPILLGAIEGAPKGFSNVYLGRYGTFSVVMRWIASFSVLAPLFVVIIFMFYISRTKRPKPSNYKMLQQETLADWLHTSYQLIIRNKEDHYESTTVTFSYAKLIRFSIIIFLGFLLVSLFLIETVLEKWFDPKYHPQIEIQVPDTLLDINE